MRPPRTLDADPAQRRSRAREGDGYQGMNQLMKRMGRVMLRFMCDMSSRMFAVVMVMCCTELLIDSMLVSIGSRVLTSRAMESTPTAMLRTLALICPMLSEMDCMLEASTVMLESTLMAR